MPRRVSRINRTSIRYFKGKQPKRGRTSVQRRNYLGYSSISRIRTRPHMFMRWTATPGGVGSIANVNLVSDTFVTIAFKLSDLPDFADFTSLYDQYRINKVVLNFRRTNDYSNQAALAAGIRSSMLYTIIDHDDIGVPTLAEMRQYANCKEWSTDRDHSRATVPAVLVQNYETSIATAYTPKFKQWVSTTDPGTQHFGMKVCLHMNDNTPATNATIIIITAKYYISCKNVK